MLTTPVSELLIVIGCADIRQLRVADLVVEVDHVHDGLPAVLAFPESYQHAVREELCGDNGRTSHSKVYQRCRYHSLEK